MALTSETQTVVVGMSEVDVTVVVIVLVEMMVEARMSCGRAAIPAANRLTNSMEQMADMFIRNPGNGEWW